MNRELTQQRLQHLAGLLMATLSFSSAAGRLGEPKVGGKQMTGKLLSNLWLLSQRFASIS